MKVSNIIVKQNWSFWIYLYGIFYFDGVYFKDPFFNLLNCLVLFNILIKTKYHWELEAKTKSHNIYLNIWKKVLLQT